MEERLAKLDFANEILREIEKAKPILDRALEQSMKVMTECGVLEETIFFVTSLEYKQLIRCGHRFHRMLEGMPVEIRNDYEEINENRQKL